MDNKRWPGLGFAPRLMSCSRAREDNGTTKDTKSATYVPLSRNALIMLVGAWGFEPQTPTASTPSLVTL